MAHARSPEGWAPTSRRTIVIAAVAVVVVIAAGVALLTGRSDSKPAKKADPPAPTTTTVKKAHAKPPRPKSGPLAPLTGEVAYSKAAAKRCAVTVKIGNTADARPQFGLNDADIVYEEVVDGGITRLAAVFQSEAPTKVGTIRSVRPTDHTIVLPLRGIFAFSGGNAQEVASIEGAPVVLDDETRSGPLMFRDPNGSAPNNLYAHVDQMYRTCPGPAPRPIFTFRKPHVPPAGDPVRSGTISFANPYGVVWTWKPNAGLWKRTKFGKPDIGADGGQISATNVVVMSVAYDGGPAGIDNRGVLTGSGPLVVFSAGRIIRGTWSRTDENRAARLLDRHGKVIPLTTGRTWVELPDVSYPVTSLR